MSSPEVTRVFVCIELPDPVRAQAGALQNALSSLNEIRWVRPSNLHLTLRFLGEIPRLQVENACSAVQRAASRVETFCLHLLGTGCFPSIRLPKAFWIGVAENLELTHLFEVLEEELHRVGFAREDRPFSPHLTLGRVRVDRASAKVRGALAAAAFDAAPFLVTHMTVMKSELGKSGPVYTPVAHQPLKSTAGLWPEPD